MWRRRKRDEAEALARKAEVDALVERYTKAAKHADKQARRLRLVRQQNHFAEFFDLGGVRR